MAPTYAVPRLLERNGLKPCEIDLLVPHQANSRIILSATERLGLARDKVVATCRKCHAGVGANFARYDPHADPESRERNPGLFYTSQFMKLLLGSVFAFFGLHTALWLPRSWKARRENLGRE